MGKNQIIKEPFEEFNQPEFADFEDESAKTELGKGLFWLVKTKEGNFQILCCKLLCFRDGITLEEVERGFCENDGISHERAWDKMQKDERIKKFSQDMRKNATKEENTLWYQYLRKYPVQFRRQCPIGPYIVDFYCSKARLVIELDGSQHFDASGVEYDNLRTQYLESLGLKTLRFCNTDVRENLRGVCQQIDLEMKQRYSAEPLQDGVGRKAFAVKYAKK
jgi:very-short-patch-repair endonuclease